MREISKELLSEVLGMAVFNIRINDSGNKLFYDFATQGRSMPCINLHELAHKCKEWAFKKGYELMSGKMNHSGVFMCVLTELNPMIPKRPFDSNTEHEAIFKATQWVLEQIKQ